MGRHVFARACAKRLSGMIRVRTRTTIYVPPDIYKTMSRFQGVTQEPEADYSSPGVTT